MRKRIWIILFVTLAALIVLSACNTGGSQSAAAPMPDASQPSVPSQSSSEPDSWENEKLVKISYSSQYAPGHITAQLEQFLFDTVYEMTGGTVEFIPYWSSSLFTQTSGYVEVMAGTADGTQIPPFTAMDHFKIEPAMVMFFASAPFNYKQKVMAFEEFFGMTPELQEEWAGLIPINWGTGGTDLYMMTTTPIATLEDLRGKTFRVTGDHIIRIIEELNGLAIKMPSGEVFDAMTRGILQGAWSTLNSMTDVNYIDVCKYVTPVGIHTEGGLNRFMRKDKYNEMSPKQQEAFQKALLVFRAENAIRYTANEQRILDYCRNNGVTIFDLPEKDKQLIRDKLNIIALEEVEKLNAMGYDGTRMYNDAQMLIAKYLQY